MLALSTFRKSELAVHTAIQKAKSIGELLVVFVADVNLAQYFIGAEHGLHEDLERSCEADLLKLHEKEGRGYVAEIAAKAELEDVEMKAIIEVGPFADICLDMIEKEKPSLVVTTRSQRPAWVKRFFGAPVTDLIEKANCPIMVVEAVSKPLQR